MWLRGREQPTGKSRGSTETLAGRMNCLYPNEYQIDIAKEAREFYRSFLDVDVPNEEMKNVIYP